jgi:hypothetical protein
MEDGQNQDRPRGLFAVMGCLLTGEHLVLCVHSIGETGRILMHSGLYHAPVFPVLRELFIENVRQIPTSIRRLTVINHHARQNYP